MAVTASGLFYATWSKAVNTTQLGLDLDLETHKGALFVDAVSPTFATDTAYGVAPYNANEVPGTGNYTTAGQLLTTTVVTDEAGSLTWDADDMSWASSTIANAMCVLIYADANVTVADAAILLVDFVTAASTSSGTFTITWAVPGSGGIFNIDLTPA